MADDTFSDTPSFDQSWPTESFEIPSNPEGDEAEGFGAAPPMDLLTPKVAGAKVDPRTLKGSFFFLDVYQSKRSDAGGQPSATGSFNALAYDPLWTGQEKPEEIIKRYGKNPPYIETLTDSEQNIGNMADIRGARGTIVGLFGANQTTWTETKWYYKEPIMLGLSFNPPNGSDWGYNCAVGTAAAYSSTDPLFIRPTVNKQFRPIMRRKHDMKHAFTAKKDNNTECKYVIEFFTPPV